MAFFDRQTASLSRMRDLKETNFTNVQEHVSHVGAFNYLHFYRAFFCNGSSHQKNVSTSTDHSNNLKPSLYVYQITLFATEKYLTYWCCKASHQRKSTKLVNFLQQRVISLVPICSASLITPYFPSITYWVK